MILALILVLAILWFFGYVSVGNTFIPSVTLFTINGQDITLWNLLIFLIIAAAVGVLPSPLRQIAGVVLILWVLATLNIFAIPGLASLLVIAIIVGLVLALLGVF